MVDSIVGECAIRVMKKCFAKGITDTVILAKFIDWLHKNDLQDEWIGKTEQPSAKPMNLKKQAEPIERPKMRVYLSNQGEILKEGDLEHNPDGSSILSLNPDKKLYVSPEDEDYLNPLSSPDDELEPAEEEPKRMTEEDIYKNSIPVKWFDETGKVWSGDALCVAEGTKQDLLCFCHEDGLHKCVSFADILEESKPSVVSKFFN